MPLHRKNYVRRITLLFALALIFSGSLFSRSAAYMTSDTSYFKPGETDANLIQAVIKNDTSAVKLLLDRGADPNTISSTGNSALIYATESGNLYNMKLLVEKGADVNASGFNDETPLFTAIFHNDFEAAKYLLEQGANPNVKDSYGVTPLIYAAATNQYQSADLLLFYEADETIHDSKGNDPLMAAVTFENIETSDVLLQNGLDPDVQDQKGNTPLIAATQHGTYAIMDLLLDYNADVNLANNKNYTPLAYAVVYEDTIAMNMLLTEGADADHQISKGRNIMEIARKTNNREVIGLLESNGADLIPRPDFSDLYLSTGHSFNGTDYMTRFRGAVVDSKYGFYGETGVDYRPFLLRYQFIENDTIYQFRERRIGWSHGIGKYFTLARTDGNVFFSTYGSLTGLLSFPSYTGTARGNGVQYTLIPGAGLSMTGRYAGLKAGVEWYRFGNMLESGLKYNISLFFRIIQPENHYDRKEIYWE